ncbi:MAG: hypothetical protein ACKESB_03050 [Candidatus Hodgkinia cicadicola]
MIACVLHLSYFAEDDSVLLVLRLWKNRELLSLKKLNSLMGGCWDWNCNISFESKHWVHRKFPQSCYVSNNLSLNRLYAVPKL